MTVDRAALIAKIQQKVLDRSKQKFQRNQQANKPQQNRPDNKQQPTFGTLWRDRQLRDYRKANNLCFHCGEKFDPGHLEVCTKKNKPQLHALALNDLDREISEEALNELAIEDLITEDFCQLSLNALTDAEASDSIRLKATVQNKTMLILLDTGSSHSFVSSQFVKITKLTTSPIATQKVKMANGHRMTTSQQVKNLTWYIQGHSFSKDMIVLDTLPYDAIQGYDWLRQYSPMTCDWQAKTLQFQHQGKQILLKGIPSHNPEVTPMSAKQVYKSTKGNDIWAFCGVSIGSCH